jgi:hypothetical protein
MSSRSRRGPTSSQRGSSSSSSSLRRSARLASVPGEDQVQRRREGEQSRGCPPAPHNSVDQSLIVLDETLQENIQEVFQEGGEATAGPTEGRPVPTDDEEELIVIGDDTVDGEDTSDIDVLIDDLSPMTSPRLPGGSYSPSTTIDLTDSPVASPEASPSSSPQSPRLHCPVCLDTFSTIRNKGLQLVSTVCGHVFCSSCLSTCLRSRDQCPTCRKILRSRDFHPLFL